MVRLLWQSHYFYITYINYNNEWKRSKKTIYNGGAEFGKVKVNGSAGITQAGKGKIKINKNGEKHKFDEKVHGKEVETINKTKSGFKAEVR